MYLLLFAIRFLKASSAVDTMLSRPQFPCSMTHRAGDLFSPNHTIGDVRFGQMLVTFTDRTNHLTTQVLPLSGFILHTSLTNTVNLSTD